MKWGLVAFGLFWGFATWVALGAGTLAKIAREIFSEAK